MSEFFNKKFPRNEAESPKLMNTKENPKTKNTVFTNTELFFF